MSGRISLRRFALASAFLLTAVFGATLAATAQDASAPMRAARLTSSQGAVTVTDGNNPSAPAQMNLPLLAGVQIATGADGQAEIEFEDGSIVRLTPNSALSLDRLDIAPGQIFITDLGLLRGLAYFELRATPQYAYSVNAGGDVLSPVENATVRVNFDQAPASFAVLDGSAAVQRANSYQTDVRAGETLRDDAGNPSSYSLTEQIAADSWDQWNSNMDQQAATQSGGSTSVRDSYAGAQGYGWGDLDADGTWYNVPGTGQVWQPYSAEDDAGFDPYGNGAWVWYPGTGYLWASAYPWGWTPYRCGAWSYYNSFGWGWVPGAACGGYGWGFAGGGFVVNIAIAPHGYRPVRVPIAKPGPVRPVLPVRITNSPARPVGSPQVQRGPRQIAGVTAQPITPAHVGFAAVRGNQGGSLQRDFPIDRATHAPQMGAASTQPAHTTQPQAPQQSGQPQPNSERGKQNGEPAQQSVNRENSNNSAPSTQTNPQQQPSQQQGFRYNGADDGSTGGTQGQRTRGLQQGNATQSVPQQNSVQPPRPAPPAYQRPVYTPPAQPQHTAPEHPMNAPAPQRQQRQNFTPAPAPHYSPPPAPAPHFSPPPPPPHVSAPPPPSSNAPSHK